MKVFIGFFIAVFVASAILESHGRTIRRRTLLAAATLVGASFYSLKVVQ